MSPNKLIRHVQVAQFSAEMERYEPAIEVYEDVATRSMDNNLLKFSAKGYLLNAGICRLCGESLFLHILSQQEAACQSEHCAMY